MPFKKIDVNKEISSRIDHDEELKKAYVLSQREYDVIKQLVRIRNEMGISQNEIATKSGLTQQMVSRIETADNSPTLKNFIRYVDTLGLQIRFEKRIENTHPTE